MITKLTKEQELQIPKTIEKWVNKASEPMNHDKVIEYTRKMYKSMNTEEPIIIFGHSPMNCVLLCELFFKLTKDNPNLLKEIKQLSSQLSSQLGSQLYSQLYSQLSSQLSSQLDSQLYSQLSSQLSSQLGSQLRSQLSSQLHSQLRSQLNSQLYSQLSSQPNNEIIKSINSNWYLGMFWLVWCGWYEFGKSIGVKFDNDKYDLFMNYNSEVSFIIPYKGICFISEKPVNISWKNGVLHKDMGMSVKYADGWGVHTLNGTPVPKYLAETPEGALDIEFFKKETNADVKAEFIRKYGINRMESLGKEVDTFSNYKNRVYHLSEYKLLNMGDVFNTDRAMFLRMKNQSVDGVFHIEGVHPDCNTIEDALKYRANNRIIKLEGVK